MRETIQGEFRSENQSEILFRLPYCRWEDNIKITRGRIRRENTKFIVLRQNVSFRTIMKFQSLEKHNIY